MWPMCGGEHYSEDNRYKIGYDNFPKREDETGFDLNKYIWKKKRSFGIQKLIM